jgi:hypothetical protein
LNHPHARITRHGGHSATARPVACYTLSGPHSSSIGHSEDFGELASSPFIKKIIHSLAAYGEGDSFIKRDRVEPTHTHVLYERLVIHSASTTKPTCSTLMCACTRAIATLCVCVLYDNARSAYTTVRHLRHFSVSQIVAIQSRKVMIAHDLNCSFSPPHTFPEQEPINSPLNTVDITPCC